MKVRVKFRKDGVMRYIGHLDVMRYFQKLLRRADIPVKYSGGMSPHQIMSFAMPLSIGLTSDAEYVDIELTESISSKEAIKRMNDKNVEGFEILSFKLLPDNAANAMSSIFAADYEVSFREGYKPDFPFFEAMKDMFNEPYIYVLKKSKKNETTIDIKTGIYSFDGDDDIIRMCLSCGSVLNIKPELVISTVFERNERELNEFALAIRRKEIYTGSESELISLDMVGADIK